MTIYDLKPAFQNLLRPICRYLAAKGVTANQVTLAALALSVMEGLWISRQPESRWPLLALPVVLFMRMALNAIDGMLAREHNMRSALGGMLNELGDVISDTALYLPLARVPGFSPGSVVVFVILAIVSEMTGVVAIQVGASRRYDGPMGKSDRAFLCGVLALVGAGFAGWCGLTWVLRVGAVLLVLTIFNRARRALRECAARPTSEAGTLS